jgi:UDP:flavonoid glycosyltransferase YjiC (YdhE family)
MLPLEEKPLLLCTAFPSAGHFYPILAIASHIARAGLSEVAFVMPAEFRDSIERAGIEYIETPGITAEMAAVFQQTAQMPAGTDLFIMQMGLVFHGTLARRAARFHEVIKQKTASRSTGRQNIVLLEDALSLASAPYRYWKAEKTGVESIGSLPAIGIGVSLLFLESTDVGPLLMGLPPDATASGKLRNRELHRLVRERSGMRALQASWEAALRDCGCSLGADVPQFRIWNTGYEAYDVVYQMSVPGAEYPMSDIPANVHFAGALPCEKIGSDYEYPEWWNEVVQYREEGESKHRIVFVSQGTINSAYEELVLPTIRAFAGRSGVLVVATLGVRGAVLPTSISLPSNVRVVDYMPYDVMLALTDVFVTNSGYGAFTHAIRNGVPMVAAGETEEKKEVALRVAYSGAGVSLGTQTPSLDQVRKGVDEVLESPRYKRRAEELMVESKSLDCLRTIEEKIKSFWRLA